MKQLKRDEKWVPLKLPKNIGKDIGTELRSTLLTEGGAHYYYKDVPADKSPSGKAFRYRNWVTTPDKLELCQQMIADVVEWSANREKEGIFGVNFENRLKEKTSEAQKGAAEASAQQNRQHQKEMAM